MITTQATVSEFLGKVFDDVSRNLWNSAATGDRDLSQVRRSIWSAYKMARWLYEWAGNDTTLQIIRSDGPTLFTPVWELPDDLEAWSRDPKADRFVAKLVVMDEADGPDWAQVIILTSTDTAYAEAMLRFSDLDLSE